MALTKEVRELLTAVNLCVAPANENVNLEFKYVFSRRLNRLTTRYKLVHWIPETTNPYIPQDKIGYYPTIYEYSRIDSVMLKLSEMYQAASHAG